MFRVVLEEYRALCQLRKRLEAEIATRLAALPDFARLQTIPGVGPILAMIILAEARDLRRFGCVRQFLKYCGFDLCTEQSGQFRGTTHLSKRGQRPAAVRLLDGGHASRSGCNRTAFAGSLRTTFAPDPKSADRRRKGYTAVAAKMARVAYAVVTTGTDYRRFPEATRPGGRIPSPGAVEAHATS